MGASTRRGRECSKCGKNRSLALFATSRARVCDVCKRETRRKAHRKQTVAVYDITPVEYDRILKAQDGGCGGCGRAPRRNEWFDVDHDHRLEAAGETPRACVRGLLCRACNRKVLPYARNNPDTLRRLADYLEEPPAVKVLYP